MRLLGLWEHTHCTLQPAAAGSDQHMLHQHHTPRMPDVQADRMCSSNPPTTHLADAWLLGGTAAGRLLLACVCHLALVAGLAAALGGGLRGRASQQVRRRRVRADIGTTAVAGQCAQLSGRSSECSRAVKQVLDRQLLARDTCRAQRIWQPHRAATTCRTSTLCSTPTSAAASSSGAPSAPSSSACSSCCCFFGCTTPPCIQAPHSCCAFLPEISSALSPAGGSQEQGARQLAVNDSGTAQWALYAMHPRCGTSSYCCGCACGYAIWAWAGRPQM
jgi:hypothetical protein